jgi:hypothetical protein
VKPGSRSEWFFLYGVTSTITAVICVFARLWGFAATFATIAVFCGLMAWRTWGRTD